ncbi:MAG: hypothetical protein HYZ75_05190 [Elusimicrobia bacterium]|nr:hypothetical protein [Elusimicrobiota bacterium]
MTTALLLLLAAVPARGSDSGKVVEARHLTGIKSLLAGAERMAKQWSPGARLYSALGMAPGNPARYQPERWELFYGDPKTKDGVFHVVYDDGTVTARSGIKAGGQVVEQFQDGKLIAQRMSEVEWVASDYEDCLPIREPFIDTALLDKEVRAVPLEPDDGVFRVVLLRPKNDDCDGLGHMSLYLPEKPVPKSMKGKSLWIVTGPEERVFFDAKTGKPLLRRLRGSKGP